MDWRVRVLSLGKRRTLALLVTLWVIMGLAYLYYVASSQHAVIEAELERESRTLHRIVSQRADQHDAHLTSLSALASSGEVPKVDLVLQVVGAIRRFYPRVTAVDLVALQTDKTSITTRADTGEIAIVWAAARAAAARSSGKFELLPSPAAAGHYLIVKRSPNSDHARFGLTIEIDAQSLVDTESSFWRKPGASVSLSLPDDSVLVTEATTASSSATRSAFTRRLTTRRELGSRTQPLILTTRFVYGADDLFPAGRVVVGLIIIGGVLVVLALVIKLVLKTRSAELRARLGEQDARIAHASRVNALGEIASGMAHELNQPLTAILSQSQAGIRLIARRDADLASIEKILQTNIAQSKRAANIIVRLREWTRTTTPVSAPQSVNRCIENVVFLLGPDSRRLGMDLTVKSDPAEPEVLGDGVEIEQILFNLVRNAMEALEQSPEAGKRISVSSLVSRQHVIVEVSDSGPGISPEMRERLFEPFATGKEKGMGLGLVLCERIVERMGGSIEILDAPGGGVTARVSLPLATKGKRRTET